MPHITNGREEYLDHEVVGRDELAYIKTVFNNHTKKGALEIWYRGPWYGRYELLDEVALNSGLENALGVHNSVLAHWRRKLKAASE